MGIKLRDIISNYEIKEQEFEYAGVEGVAELLGWQIIAFYKMDDLLNSVALAFEQITSSELINISNLILECIDFEIRFSDGKEEIEQYYGKANFIDDIYEDILKYNYILSSNYFISFGLKDNKLISLEIIMDEDIIKEVVDSRNYS